LGLLIANLDNNIDNGKANIFILKARKNLSYMRLYRDFRLIFEGTSIWVSETIVDITEFIYSISHSIPYWNCALEINLTLK